VGVPLSPVSNAVGVSLSSVSNVDKIIMWNCYSEHWPWLLVGASLTPVSNAVGVTLSPVSNVDKVILIVKTHLDY